MLSSLFHPTDVSTRTSGLATQKGIKTVPQAPWFFDAGFDIIAISGLQDSAELFQAAM
jgi:hypothetical protein